MYPSTDDIILTFTRYDLDKTEILSFKEVASMLLPEDENYKKLAIERKPLNMG